jgi:hypothetical protein
MLRQHRLCGLQVASLPSDDRGGGAGEAVSERDELDNGPSFFGEAKEVGSPRPMQNVQVRAEVGERRISTYTNDEGSFKIPGFGKELRPIAS